MPIFSRRCIQQMHGDLATALGRSHISEIDVLPASLHPEDVLAAEVELGVAWTLSTMGPLEIELNNDESKRIAIFTGSLFNGSQCLIEVAGVVGEFQSEDQELLFQMAVDSMHQRRGYPAFNELRCILLVDFRSETHDKPNISIGSYLADSQARAAEVLLSDRSSATDVVLVLSRNRISHSFWPTQERIHWTSKVFARPGLSLQEKDASKLASRFPIALPICCQEPSGEHTSAHCREHKYLKTRFFSEDGATILKVSLKAISDFLVGQISREMFQKFTGLGGSNAQVNYFGRRLEHDAIFANSRIELGGIDDDDDWLVLELKHSHPRETKTEE